MRMITLAVAFTAAFASVAQAQNNNPLSDSTFTCDFSPTDSIRPGLIYTIQNKIVFPAGAKEKFLFVTPEFEKPYDVPTASNFGGTRKTETITMEAAANFLGTSKAKLGASSKKKIDIERAIPNHKGVILYQTQLQPAYDWFSRYKKTSAYKKRQEYFLVTEVRFSDTIKVSMTKQAALELGASADAAKVGEASLVAKREYGSSYELEGKFVVPSVFCMKVDRLN